MRRLKILCSRIWYLFLAISLFSTLAIAQYGGAPPPPSSGGGSGSCSYPNYCPPPSGGSGTNSIGGGPGTGQSGTSPSGNAPSQSGPWNGTCSIPSNVSSWLRSYKPAQYDGAHFGAMTGFGYYTNGTVWKMIYNSGMPAFYANKSAFSSYLNQYNKSLNIIGNISRNLGLGYARGAGSVDWYFVEPSLGVFNYTLSDDYVRTMEQYGLQPVITIGPFAPWDAVNSPNRIAISGSGALDFLIFGKYLSAPYNVTAYEQFVANVARRYGGGAGSMPGLKYPVKYYEVWNEPTGSFSLTNASASPFLQNYSAFGALVIETRTALSSVLGSNFYLTPGGAIEAAGGGAFGAMLSRRNTFYNVFYSNVSSGELNALNFHYNGDKNFAPNQTYFSSTLSYQTSYQSKYQNLPKPLWLTEFGTYSGSPRAGMSNLTYQSQAQQAAWLVERSAYAFGAGVTVISGLDAQGGTSDNIGSAAYVGFGGQLYSPQSCSYRVQAYTQKLLDILINNFTSVTQLAPEQYAFHVPQGTVYIMWSTGANSTKPASQMNGTLNVFDIYGNKQAEGASQLLLSSMPVLAATYNVSTTQASSVPSTATTSASTTAPSTSVQATTSIAQQNQGGNPISSFINGIINFFKSLFGLH